MAVTTELTIQGMSCEGCVRGVTRALSGVAGATVEQVRIGAARVRHDPVQVPAEALVAAIRKAGFDAAVAGNEKAGGQ